VGTLEIASKSNSGIGAAVGTISVSGGALTVTTAFTLVSQIDTPTSVGATTGTLNITGGIVTSDASILDGGGIDACTVILSGGTLNLTGNSIGTTTAPITALNFSSGTIENVAQIDSGATPLVNIGTGTLTLAGTNSYSGGTNVSAGTLILSSGLLSYR
jgi:fibronectin-binding autotransporter adhesin